MTTPIVNTPNAETANNWGEAIAIDDEGKEVDVELEPFGEREKFSLAKWVLFGVLVLFLLGGVALLTNPTTGETIFETCKAVLPPIATLVIGYYFSERSSS